MHHPPVTLRTLFRRFARGRTEWVSRLGHFLPALWGAALLPLSGCAQFTLSHQAMALNKTVHNHRVDQLLLNVIRASRHEPTAVTTIGGFVQRNSDTRRASLGVPFGRLAPDLYDGNVSASYEQSPEMTMTILDNQKEFIDGFMSPIAGETIAFFIKQGWNMEMLAHLLVEAIEQPVDAYPPERRAEMIARYPSRIRRTDEGLDYIRIPNEPAAGDTYFARLIAENVQRMEIREIVHGPGGEPVEEFVIPGSDVRLVIRSPQGVIFYLGELARLSQDPETLERVPSVGGEPLFLVRRHARAPGNGNVCVRHRGVWYAIPDRPANRSLAALNLVQQLIDLQDKEIDPNPSAVRLLGN